MPQQLIDPDIDEPPPYIPLLREAPEHTVVPIPPGSPLQGPWTLQCYTLGIILAIAAPSFIFLNLIIISDQQYVIWASINTIIQTFAVAFLYKGYGMKFFATTLFISISVGVTMFIVDHKFTEPQTVQIYYGLHCGADVLLIYSMV